MKNILVMLFLLQTQTLKTLPDVADAYQSCSSKMYWKEDLNQCCNKCSPGYRLMRECTETSESLCVPCPPNQTMGSWNYAKNCLSCSKCRIDKGLQYAQNCSSTTKAKCICMPGRYCIMGYRDGQCQDCASYSSCKVGFGVLVPGTATSDVKCRKCPAGTFSDTVSYTDVCKPHSDCNERDIIRKGDADSDTVCKPAASTRPNAMLKTETTTIITASSTPSPVSKTTPVTTESMTSHLTNSITLSISTIDIYNSIKSQVPNAGHDNQLAAVIGGVTGILLLIIVTVLVVFCKHVIKKDALGDCPKVDANGNCESDSDNINICYLRDTQRLSFKAMQPEQQCLLQNGEVSQNQCISGLDGYSSNESIEPLQSTLPLHQLHSALSEPMTLQSQDYAISQNGAIPQPCSQPTSPQNITPSPFVNVNINLHIGNGTCGTPAVILKDMLPTDPKIPFGEEEESCSFLQQEDGKPSLLSVEESGNLSNRSLKTLEHFV